MDNRTQKTLFSKLIRPIHISYIQKYILKMSLDETKEIINDLINQGIVEESRYGVDYYVLKNKNNE